MVARRALAVAGGIQCRSAVSKLLLAPSSTYAKYLPQAVPTRPGLVYLPIRAFSAATQPGEPQKSSDPSENSEISKSDEPTSEDRLGAEEEDASDVPWYLQVEPPRHATAAEPEPLPEIPAESPAVLQPLVEYVSDELGLHDLSLLDLRALDPPAALGPNLMMLFGTARSERHLHVSGGRLVRWLKSQHRILADADGLMGPKERKIKLRRKTRRAKLLGTMGEDETDDGIRTGWICVHLGSVQVGENTQTAIVGEDGRMAGFGVSQRDTTLVVQIMTESRRAGLDLESLWTRLLERQQSPSSAEPAEEEEENWPTHPVEQAIASKAHPTHSTAIPGQRRSFSTMRTYATLAPDSMTGSKELSSIMDASTTQELSHILATDFSQKLRVMHLLQAELYEKRSKTKALREIFGLQQDGQQSPKQPVRKDLGGSTPFLQLANLAMQNLPAARTWHLRLLMQKAARRVGDNGVTTLGGIRQLIEEMDTLGIQASRHEYRELVYAIYCCPSEELREQSKVALELFAIMQQRGEPVISNDIIVEIIDASSRVRRGQAEMDALHQRLEQLVLQCKLPCMDEGLMMRLMQAYARNSEWDKFWNVWRLPPRFLRPRSETMYSFVYNICAWSGSHDVCASALRRCYYEMLNENPAIKLNRELRDAIFACIKVADPGVEQLMTAVPTDDLTARRLARREFLQLAKHVTKLYDHTQNQV